jgi:hypothetical protein
LLFSAAPAEPLLRCLQFLAGALEEDSPDDLVPHLAALARIAKYGNASFEKKSEQITVQCLEILRRQTRDAEVRLSSPTIGLVSGLT